MTTQRTKHWEIKTIEFCDANGGVRVIGTNHFTGERFRWAGHGEYGFLRNAEYDARGARYLDERAERHVAKYAPALHAEIGGKISLNS